VVRDYGSITLGDDCRGKGCRRHGRGEDPRSTRPAAGVDLDATFRQVHPATALVYHHERVNQGKGWCLRRGIALATGDCIVIQDADLEYDPADHAAMLRPILEPWKPRDRQGVLDLGGLGDDRPAPLQAAQLTPVL
jgi:hypothetical protein